MRRGRRRVASLLLRLLAVALLAILAVALHCFWYCCRVGLEGTEEANPRRKEVAAPPLPPPPPLDLAAPDGSMPLPGVRR